MPGAPVYSTRTLSISPYAEFSMDLQVPTRQGSAPGRVAEGDGATSGAGAAEAPAAGVRAARSTSPRTASPTATTSASRTAAPVAARAYPRRRGAHPTGTGVAAGQSGRAG